MKHTPILFSLALLGSLSLSPLAAAETPSAQQVCAALTKSAKKAGKKADAKAKARLALAAAIKRLEKTPEDVNVRSKGKGITPLMIATALGEKDAIRWLISIGADPTIKDASGKDSLARAKDEEVTTLLKEGAIFTWEEAITYLENSEDEACRFLLDDCRKCSTSEKKYEIGNFLMRCARTDTKMTSFVYRLGNLDYRNSLHFSSICELPSGKNLAMLNLLDALGHQWNLWSNYAGEALRQDKKLAKWAKKKLAADDLIFCGAEAGLNDMIELGIHKAKKEGTEPEELYQHLGNAIGIALKANQEETINFLLKQDRGGYSSFYALRDAVENNRVDLLKLLVDDAPEKLYEPHDGYVFSLHESLWQILPDAIEHDEAYKYLKAKLKDAPVTSESKDEASGRPLSRTLYFLAGDDADDVKNGKEANPRRLEIARMLLEHGANINCSFGSSLETAQSEEMKKLLQQAKDKQQGK